MWLGASSTQRCTSVAAAYANAVLAPAMPLAVSAPAMPRDVPWEHP
eukprot:CAMPEP_0115473844 /NCGR_PEP_ID=MMETSP0271-20121206/53780_1 /TAXON_ID=71861 /ORGANISM="Scrippsiella trochoidea, Strain CCMP3099" /LENGTH=45 /DNA_ID= /DNA_START= /DNA_END= /DNA_ORIENTATION=